MGLFSMIVNDLHGKWEIIFQRAHAKLAADIAMKIAPEYHPKAVPFTDMIAALVTHDDGRKGWQSNFHIDSHGRPINYKDQKLTIQLQQAEKCQRESSYRSQWVELLITMHHIFLYSPIKDPTALSFVEKQIIKKQQLISSLAVRQNDAEDVYLFMQLCDELSLILCENRWETGLCAGKLAPNVEVEIICGEKDISFQPHLFAQNDLLLAIEVFVVPKKVYKSDFDLLNSIQAGRPGVKKWNITRELKK